MPAATTWIAVPLIGGIIGYLTNRIAVRMIFRPVRPISILGFRVQGLIGRRQRELAESIGQVVGDHLVRHEDVVKSLSHVDFEAILGDVLDSALAPKIQEMQRIPVVGGLLSEARVASLRGSLIAGVLEHREIILEKIEQAVEKGLDVQAVVTDKIAAFSVAELESLVLAVAAKELRAIEIFGAVLGVLIGFTQVLLIWSLS